MPSRKKDVYPGIRIGRRVIIMEVSRKGKQRRFLCRCDCGKEYEVDISSFRKKNVVSCGCYRKELVAERSSTHRKSKTPLYRVWSSMKDRCFRKTAEHYKDYGGRGITVCKEWLDFHSFDEWAQAHGYTQGLTLERINNDGNYCPENCKWISQAEQKNNTRRSNKITINGETLNLQQWCTKLGIRRHTVEYRVNNGWSIEKALMTPVGGSYND